MLDEEVYPKSVKELLGHGSVKMTPNRYSRVMTEMQRDAADRLYRLAGGA
jgi:hypothetical protein